MTRSSSRASSLSQALMEGQRTTLTKWVLIVLLNMVAFVLAWLANGRPTPDLTQWPFSFYLNLFPGPLQPIGRLFLTLAGALLNRVILQYLLIANLAGMIPFFFGALYIKKLYGMDSVILALVYLWDSLFEPSFYRFDVQEDEEPPTGYGQGGGGSRRVALVVDGKLVPAGQRPANRTIAWAGGPGKVVVSPDYAAQLERSGRLTRVVGPGVARLHRFEKIYKLISLRPVIRSREITALTRDGIPVTVELTVHSRARGSASPAAQSSSPPHYPFEAQTITMITLDTWRSGTGYEDWEDRAIETAIAVLTNVLAQYSVDEIFESLGAESDPRQEIQEQVREKTAGRLEDSGVEITELWLGQFDLPAEVTGQYVEFWQAGWKRKDQTVLAKGEAATIRELGRARALAQKEVIEALVASFQTAQKAVPEIPPKQLLALRFIDGLEQLARQAAKFTGDTETQQQNLARLRQAIRDQGQKPKEGQQDGT